ncbi:MAG: hypothetical protein ACLP50_30895 [Solirubrobacteraceae bacterium]
MSRVSKTAVWAVAVGLCSAVIAAPAAAKSERVIGGHTTIAASSDITKLVDFLRAQGITVTAIGPARLANGSLTMPMVSGSMSVPSMRGVMDAKGGLQFKKGNRVLRVRRYILSHQAGGATLSALVSGRRVSQRRIVIARMVASTVNMSGHTGTMTGGLELTATWAHLINQLLGKHVLRAGADLGALSATVKVA